MARLEPIARLLGCGDSAPVDSIAVNAFGLDGIARQVRVACGPGAIRALLLELDSARPLRELLPRLAARLSRRVPQALLIIVATQRDRGDVAIATWGTEPRRPRLSALVASRSRVTDSDAETLRALAAAVGNRDLLTHARWVELLGRERLGARFYRELESAVKGMARSSMRDTGALRDELALLDASRLLFLCFLEAKGWLDGNHAFLSSMFDACMAEGGGFRRRVLLPLFFGTLNTPRARRSRVAAAFGDIPFLNGGLFSRTGIERRGHDISFSDDAYGALIYDLFGQYRFTAAEESADWNEAAIDPEMLGRAFESLMAARERRSTGAYFTPFPLVDRVASFALADAFAVRDPIALARLTVLDPACGSGAFLVHTLERIAARLAALGDTRSIATIRREVLTRSIFGVDVNPTAVWLCQLRLWLSVVIESEDNGPDRVAPLPNLDRNIRVGDALATVLEPTFALGAHGARVRQLRLRYSRASGGRKRSLARELDRAERVRALATIDAELASVTARRRDLLAVRRGRDLFGDRYQPSRDQRDAARALRQRAVTLRVLRRRVADGGALPFSFNIHFADAAQRGGFDVIVGNPPWVRLHNIPVDQRSAFRRDFFVARAAAWDSGAAQAGAGAGFAAQIDLASLFVERSLGLLSPAGTMALLVPSKLWRSLAGGGVRRLLLDRASLRRIEDHSEAPGAFDAAVYPSLVVASRPDDTARSIVDVVVHHRGDTPFAWLTPRAHVPFDATPGAPWLLLPREARRAFDAIRNVGITLAESTFGRPLLGVKCGCNDAFIGESIDRGNAHARLEMRDGRMITIEPGLVRPLLRGEQLQRWSVPEHRASIVWTHDAAGGPLGALPPLASQWFQRWRRRLVARADARATPRWWSLFRTEGARNDVPRVVWADVGREPRAVVLDSGDAHVPLNTCYVARAQTLDDALALAALLNSPVGRAWLDALAEPARGGYRRYLGWTLALLPIPSDWNRARDILAPLARASIAGCPASDEELMRAAIAAYGIPSRDVAPLVAWTTP
jgi:hypothetical protein